MSWHESLGSRLDSAHEAEDISVSLDDGDLVSTHVINNKRFPPSGSEPANPADVTNRDSFHALIHRGPTAICRPVRNVPWTIPLLVRRRGQEPKGNRPSNSWPVDGVIPHRVELT